MLLGYEMGLTTSLSLLFLSSIAILLQLTVAYCFYTRKLTGVEAWECEALCLHSMHSCTTMSEGHSHFGRTLSPIHSDCMLNRRKQT